MVEWESVALDKESDMLLEEVISKSEKKIDEDSPQDLLWEQQRKQLDLKIKSSMKWHPVVIFWKARRIIFKWNIKNEKCKI